ncbi:WXG100 family type VII secretion target [Allocatelliglobosispora scoriae]|uniref:WXG100 family type VII secretion target n=1 Tax=Allocatelliglobosispora scoriae TaxID=643052 RepID=A0A841BJM5_9ACTN|nr:WXG100 family type VII secretion target [Allocatelliglobosispora scoriae]MBB5867369.1 WXG100 family type VII secretion target [Allocatelliglobosispora scoriae]
MTVIGGEITQLHSLQGGFNRHAGTVEDLLRELRGQLDSTYWKGGAAERFRSDWATLYEPALTKLSGALQEAATHVRLQADRFEQAGG